MKTDVNKQVLSIILGGGKGTRLYPLTEKRSKPAVPIAGKYRLVDIPISNCINSGINQIFVLTQYNSASLNRHIKNAYTFDRFSQGFVDILAAEQTSSNPNWFQGTADAVRQSFTHFQDIDFDYLLILSGDQLYSMDFQEMINHHIEAGAALTIATIPVVGKDATGFGIMKTDENQKITAFIEKPSADQLPEWISETGEAARKEEKNYLASMGIYLFDKELIRDILENGTGLDFGKDIIPELIKTEYVSSYQYAGYWTDIGTISSFFETNLELCSDIPKFDLYSPGTSIYTRTRMLPPAKVMETEVDKALLSDGCIIHAKKIVRSLIGIRTRIGRGSEIENSYILGSDSYESLEEILENQSQKTIPTGIGENTLIKNAIIDKNVRIGNNVKIIGSSALDNQETPLYTVVDGIVVVKKGVTIPDNTVVA
ncbi:MAG: glucose-1-phosphate adenylyltransferase [Flavobacteriaceae bacterium]|jgi:glucose-1-phosphate adenylyltransferase|nr:glucose-1-phosphate adenylyltransferase [Flavobacteriaceae bacterium]